jgi:hypothetical protein
MPRATPLPQPERSRVLSTALAETARRLDIGPTELARIVGLSQPVASRLMQGRYAIKEGSKEWELAALFVRLYRGLHSIVGNSDELARSWLRSANIAFGNLEPIAVIRNVQGLVHACEYVDAHRAAV